MYKPETFRPKLLTAAGSLRRAGQKDRGKGERRRGLACHLEVIPGRMPPAARQSLYQEQAAGGRIRRAICRTLNPPGQTRVIPKRPWAAEAPAAQANPYFPQSKPARAQGAMSLS